MSSRPLRVLYDHQMFALQRFGGISRIFLELARRVSARTDASVYWYRGYHLDEYDTSSFQDRLARYWSLDRPPPGLGGWKRERINRYGMRLFTRTIWGGTDIYHPSYFDQWMPDIARSRRLAVTICDMIPERFPEDGKQQRRLLEGKRKLVERADVIFVISEHTRADLVEILHVDPAKTVLAYPASDLSDVQAARLPAELQDEPFFLYVGPRTRYKNFKVLQDAVARSDRLRREVRIVCLGGSTSFNELELQFFAEHSLTDRFVHLPGDDSLLKVLYQHAVGLVYPSRYEGFGIPPLEAMETGCPVVCCPVSSLPEVVGDAALLFDPDSPDELVDRLHTLLDDSALRTDLSARGRARARRFTWDQMVERTMAGYRSIM